MKIFITKLTKWWLCAALLCWTGLAVAQDVTGKISDEKGQALPGVSVVLKGTQKGTSTDVDGVFKLNVSESNGVLVFSFVGYLSQEVAVNNRSNINLTLKEDNKALDEVVVVGYGHTAKKGPHGLHSFC